MRVFIQASGHSTKLLDLREGAGLRLAPREFFTGEKPATRLTLAFHINAVVLRNSCK